MEEGDFFPFGADTGGFVDEPEALPFQAYQFDGYILDTEAGVVQAGAFGGQKFGDGGFGRGRFQKFEALGIVVNELNTNLIGF